VDSGERVGLDFVGEKHFGDGVKLDQRRRAVRTGAS